jgi:transcriptional regulator NrdR family protein
MADGHSVELTVIRRDGSSTPFDATKISVAVTKASSRSRAPTPVPPTASAIW